MGVVARIYIVRHGETDANRNGILQGHTDTQLNEEGIAQAKMTANALEKVHLTVAYASDLSRASKTAEIILTKHPGVELRRYEELRERFLGNAQGKTMAELGSGGIPTDAETPANFATRAIRWWNRNIVQRHVQGHLQTQDSSRPPRAPSSSGGSADTTLQSQDPGAVVSAGSANPSPSTPTETLIPQPPPDSEDVATNILVVSHGGLIGTLIVGLLGNQKLRCAEGVVVGQCMNACISVVELGEDGRGELVTYGDTTHLDGELVEVNVDEIGDNGDSGLNARR